LIALDGIAPTRG